jgi:hypothetical protein
MTHNLLLAHTVTALALESIKDTIMVRVMATTTILLAKTALLALANTTITTTLLVTATTTILPAKTALLALESINTTRPPAQVITRIALINNLE